MKAPLVVADLLYSLRQFDWLIKSAGGHDLMLIAGDLLDVGGDWDLDRLLRLGL